MDRSGFNVNPTVNYTNRNWMNYIDNSRKISELSIPGTHDSMALYGPLDPIPVPIVDESTITQTMNLGIQLNSGIRYIDIRCRHYYNTFPIYHGPVYQHAYFDDVLESVKSFLTQNPSETILMRVKEEYEENLTPPVGNTRSFGETFKSYLKGNEQYFWDFLKSPNSYNPTLGEARGKIILLQHFDANTFLGIPWYSLEPNVHDMWELDGRGQLYAKWELVREHFFKAMRNTNQIYFTHLSGTGKTSNLWIPRPWFVASGFEDPKNDSLPSALYGNPSSNWPDNPRNSPISGPIFYGGTNVLSTRRIRERRFTHTGIVVADFPGKGLIDGTIALNFPGILSGDFQIITALDDSSVIDLNVGSNNVTLWSNDYTNNKRWNFTYDQSKKAYVIRSVSNPSLVLTWNIQSTDRNVFAIPFVSGLDESYWIREYFRDGYIFKNKANTNMVLTVSGGEIKPGTNIQVSPIAVGNAQIAQTFFISFI
ncbi:hypothetical protein B7492_32505 (plasmid) [Bacillus mycoides]|uniref:1-phosphatidylinositol phosphodiesterase n=1 Tax=Bacillus mycoides TaxID=1405 RepID=A0A1W6AJ48_BACMY|nr:phosphatidylinositol-specific phospholipase C domain-containing protein [Bacillus mycoides]ARJ25761.1 hypothetical protein B7492_32505 [Bacillus mycoides]